MTGILPGVSRSAAACYQELDSGRAWERTVEAPLREDSGGTWSCYGSLALTSLFNLSTTSYAVAHMGLGSAPLHLNRRLPHSPSGNALLMTTLAMAA